MTKQKKEEMKLYDLYVTRQLGANAPLLVRIEAISAKSADEAKAIGVEKCRQYEAQANGRYAYRCKVLQGGNFKWNKQSETEERKRKDWEAAVKEVIGDGSHS